jgi:hypothetical protein
MKGLITLPYEVLANIVSYVDFDGIISLGRVCKFFQYLHTEESISKCIVQVSRPNELVMCIQHSVRFKFPAADTEPRRKLASPMKPGLR